MPKHNVIWQKTFHRELKRLRKKYHHIVDDMAELSRALEANPDLGAPIPGFHRELWKVRASSADIQKGKSGAYRVVYQWYEGSSDVHLLTVYPKVEREDITSRELERLRTSH